MSMKLWKGPNIGIYERKIVDKIVDKMRIPRNDRALRFFNILMIEKHDLIQWEGWDVRNSPWGRWWWLSSSPPILKSIYFPRYDTTPRTLISKLDLNMPHEGVQGNSRLDTTTYQQQVVGIEPDIASLYSGEAIALVLTAQVSEGIECQMCIWQWATAY